MLTRDRVRVLGGGAVGTVLGYLACRRTGPWTSRELLVLLAGVGMVVALAFAATPRKW